MYVNSSDYLALLNSERENPKSAGELNFTVKAPCYKPTHIHTYIECINQMLLSKATYNKSIYQKKAEQQYISGGTFKDFHRTKCQALTITRLTHSLYTTEVDATQF